MTGNSPNERKDGIHFEVADFHAQMKFLQVIQSKIVFNPFNGNRLFFYLLNDRKFCLSSEEALLINR